MIETCISARLAPAQLCAAAVTDHAANALSAARLLTEEAPGCTAHRIQLAVNAAIEKVLSVHISAVHVCNSIYSPIYSNEIRRSLCIFEHTPLSVQLLLARKVTGKLYNGHLALRMTHAGTASSSCLSGILSFGRLWMPSALKSASQLITFYHLMLRNLTCNSVCQYADY